MGEDIKMVPLNSSTGHHSGQSSDQPDTIITVPNNNTYSKVQQGKVLEEAKNKNWKEVSAILREYMTVNFVTEAVDSTGRTILHHACAQERNKHATDAITMMMLWEGFNKDNRRTYMDKEDGEGNMAIQLAANNSNRQLVRLLIEMREDVNIPTKRSEKNAIKLIYKNMPDVIVDLLESNLKLKEDDVDPYEDMYDVTWDFTSVTGVLEHDLVDDQNKTTTFESQTLLLSTTLQENKCKRSDVLLHPLVQLFLHYKHEKFVRWIRISMAYHISWSILSIFCWAHYAPFPAGKLDNSNPGDSLCFNGTVIESEPTIEVLEVEQVFWKWLWYIILGTTLLFGISNFVKEIHEVASCPNRRFYITQFENVGQWIHLLCALFTLFSIFFSFDNVTNWIATIGILIAGLLVLGQLGKIKLFRIYSEMFEKVVMDIVKLLCIFLPVLVSFGVLFKYLLPDRSEFWLPYIAKVGAMMTGEIGYDEVFHNEENGPAPLPLLTKSVFFCFVLLVVIVLQNLLVGLTLSDIQELKKQALEIAVAKQLEEIYLIEDFFVSWQALVPENWLKNLMVQLKGPKDPIKLKDLHQELQEVILKAIEGKPGRFKLQNNDCSNSTVHCTR